MPETPKVSIPDSAMKYVELLTGVLTVAGVGVPVVFTAVRAVISALRGADLSNLPTDAQVIDALKAKAIADRDANIAWLRGTGAAD